MNECLNEAYYHFVTWLFFLFFSQLQSEFERNISEEIKTGECIERDYLTQIFYISIHSNSKWLVADDDGNVDVSLVLSHGWAGAHYSPTLPSGFHLEGRDWPRQHSDTTVPGGTKEEQYVLKLLFQPCKTFVFYLHIAEDSDYIVYGVRGGTMKLN